MATHPRKETISSRVSEALRGEILRGDLAPGSKINLDRLREKFDISISPLREAVARLASDGLVDFEDQRGYRVTPVSLENLAEVTLLRSEFEALALRLAIEAGDLDWESNVMRALYRLTHTARDADHAEAWEAAHAEFHQALIQGCKMPLLLHFCQVLHNLNDRYRRLIGSGAESGRDLQAEHSAIASAATARRSAEACSALQGHITTTGALLAASMGRGVQTG